MARYKDEVELEVTIIHQTERAILVEGPKENVWLPKSMIEISDDETSIVAREGFLIEKGLL